MQRANLQNSAFLINHNTESKTLLDVGKKDPRRIISTAAVNTQQGTTKDSLEDLEAQFKKNLKV